MTNWRCLLVLSLSLIAATPGCDRGPERAQVASTDSIAEAPAVVEDAQLPEGLAVVIRESPRITGCLTEGQLFSLEAVTEPAIHVAEAWWHPIRSPIVALTDDQASRLRTMLLAIRRSPYPHPDCAFSADVAYRFATPTDSARVLVCHSCGEVMVLASERRWICMLVEQRQPLLEFTQELFPRDQHIEDIRSGKIRM